MILSRLPVRGYEHNWGSSNMGGFIRITALAGLVMFAAGGGCNPAELESGETRPAASDSTGRVTPVSRDARPTAIGTPLGEQITQRISAAGGKVTSADGAMTLDVPPGALAADTLISMQPITNAAPSGNGDAYRMTPDGTRFASPVKFTFKPTAEQRAGAVFGLTGIAYQDAAGAWRWAGDVEHDESKGEISVSTTHFTDYTFVPGPQIRPASATVKTGETISLAIRFCDAPVDEDPDLASPDPVYDCDEELAPLNPRFSNCSVNGILGGSSSVGTATLQGSAILYTAPAVQPSPNTVAVSVEMANVRLGRRTFDKVLLVSNITIFGRRYAGTFEFASSYGDLTTTGSADVVWTQFEDLGEVRSYRATGTVRGEIRWTDCKPVIVERPIEGRLVVNTAESVPGLRYQYSFSLNAVRSVMAFECCLSDDTPCIRETFVVIPAIGQVGEGFCLDGAPTYVDEDQLKADGFNCSNTIGGGSTAIYSWNFTSE